MTEKDRENLEKAIADLQGTCQTLGTVLERHDLPEDPTEEMCAIIDGAIFECEGCGWWCERSEESSKAPGSCDECEPD